MPQKTTHIDDRYEARVIANHARHRLRAYIEKNYGNGKDGRRRFLKALRARLRCHGQMLEQNMGHVDFNTLKKMVSSRDPGSPISLTDQDCANRLRALISQSVNKAFRPLHRQYATMIELLFDLPEGHLSMMPEKRMPAYVMLQCMGQTALALMTQIQDHPIVDEVALLVGDADLYIRIFGTNDQLQQFLLVDLYRAADLVASQSTTSDMQIAMGSIIRSTKTYTSFQDTYHLRYHPSRHPDFKLGQHEVLVPRETLTRSSTADFDRPKRDLRDVIGV